MYMIGLFLCYFMGSLSLYAATQETLISQRTKKVHKRYYFITRLKKTIALLAKINDTASYLHELIYHTAPPRDYSVMGFHFTHERVMSSLQEIAQTRSLKPLFMVWNDFSRYKSLDDELLVVDFAKEIFVITKSILENNNISEDGDRSADKMHEDIEQLLNGIDRMYDQLLGQLISAMYDPRNVFSDICHTITSDEVYIRMYYVNRLKEAIYTIKNLNTETGSYSVLHRTPTASKDLFDDRFIFINPRVYQIIAQLERDHDCEPFLLLWNDVKQFKYISNDQFMKETLIVFFILQKNILCSIDTDARSVSIKTVLELYEVIDTLPIEEILNAIDTLSRILQDVSQKETEKKSEDSWVTIKQYWWLKPLVLIASVGVKIVYHYNIFSKIKQYFLQEQPTKACFF